ncbi:MAG: TagF domain-containing protein [Chromatiales bacterium]|nr:TagF domain-containing protein [Chromatiales bacterium]
MDASINQFILDVDGQLVKYSHGPQVPQAVQWPGPRGSTQVRLQVQPPSAAGASGQVLRRARGRCSACSTGVQIENTAQPEKFKVDLQHRGPQGHLRSDHQQRAEPVPPAGNWNSSSARGGCEPMRLSSRDARSPAGTARSRTWATSPRAGSRRASSSPWDDWLQRALAGSRGALGESWLDLYLTSPLWRFILHARRSAAMRGLGRRHDAERGSRRPLLSAVHRHRAAPGRAAPGSAVATPSRHGSTAWSRRRYPRSTWHYRRSDLDRCPGRAAAARLSATRTTAWNRALRLADRLRRPTTCPPPP